MDDYTFHRNSNGWIKSNVRSLIEFFLATEMARKMVIGHHMQCEVSEHATHHSSPHGPCRPSSHMMEQAWMYTTDLPNQESMLPEAALNKTSVLSTAWTCSTLSPVGYDHSPDHLNSHSISVTQAGTTLPDDCLVSTEE
jgi:hypothetical protein